MIAQSQSGTGKTAAFVLSMLSRVDATKNFPQVVFPFTSCMFLPPAHLVKKKNRFTEVLAKCETVKYGVRVMVSFSCLTCFTQQTKKKKKLLLVYCQIGVI